MRIGSAFLNYLYLSAPESKFPAAENLSNWLNTSVTANLVITGGFFTNGLTIQTTEYHFGEGEAFGGLLTHGSYPGCELWHNSWDYLMQAKDLVATATPDGFTIAFFANNSVHGLLVGPGFDQITAAVGQFEWQ